VKVELPGGPRTFRIDERRTPSDAAGSYTALGRFPLPAGDLRIVIDTEGTTGHVIVDAVQFVEAPR
jgi:hypothetical protein